MGAEIICGIIAYQHRSHLRAGTESIHQRKLRATSRASYIMSSNCRVNRKLRIAEESSDGEDYYEVTDRSSSESVIETGAGGEIVSSDTDQEARSNNKSKSAHPKRKRGDDDSAKSHDEKLEALRRQLRQIKAKKVTNGSTKRGDAAQHNKLDYDDEKESDDESHAASKARPSKHACTGSRKRQQTSETAEPRRGIKKTKRKHERETSRKMLASIESEQKTRVAKHEHETDHGEHKKRSRSLIKEDKQPTLPKSKQKEQALIDLLETMKSKHRKKVTTRERKNKPRYRRV